MNTIVERVKGISPQVDTELTKLPKAIKLELSAFCNHNCTYCVVPNLKNQKMFMSWEIIKKSLEEIKKLGIKEIGLFHMGESTLHPHFSMVCWLLNTKYPELDAFLTTNGTQLDPLKRAVVHNVKSIKFSLNGYSHESHYRITGVDDFSKVINNLKELINYRNQIGSKTQISASSIFQGNKQQEEFAEYIEDIVDSYFQTQIYNHVGRVSTTYVPLTDSERTLLYTCGKPCYELFNLGHIKVDGTITMCRFGVDSEFNIGHINEGFEKCWFSEKAESIRKNHLTDCIKKCINKM